MESPEGEQAEAGLGHESLQLGCCPYQKRSAGLWVLRSALRGRYKSATYPGVTGAAAALPGPLGGVQWLPS